MQGLKATKLRHFDVSGGSGSAARPGRGLIGTTSTEPAGPSATPAQNQLLCCKSIDKLIAEADEPGHRLKRNLGPWSLTALGIGAIIGSGIFVLTGTAAAGEHFEAPSILHAQVLDLISISCAPEALRAR